MELTLNLVWLILALPAYWIWKQPAGMKAGRLRSFLILSCTLVLLFPVVSATDDLHPIASEIEDSNSAKRAVKSACSASSLASWHGPDLQPALAGLEAWVASSLHPCGWVGLPRMPHRIAARPSARQGRAPPLSASPA